MVVQTVATKSLTQTASREWVFDFADELLFGSNGGGISIVRLVPPAAAGWCRMVPPGVGCRLVPAGGLAACLVGCLPGRLSGCASAWLPGGCRLVSLENWAGEHGQGAGELRAGR